MIVFIGAAGLVAAWISTLLLILMLVVRADRELREQDRLDLEARAAREQQTIRFDGGWSK